jgi:hypothetical protein
MHYEIEIRAGDAWLRKTDRHQVLAEAVARAATLRAGGSVARIVQVKETGARVEVRKRDGWPGHAMRA